MGFPWKCPATTTLTFIVAATAWKASTARTPPPRSTGSPASPCGSNGRAPPPLRLPPTRTAGNASVCDVTRDNITNIILFSGDEKGAKLTEKLQGKGAGKLLLWDSPFPH